MERRLKGWKEQLHFKD